MKKSSAIAVIGVTIFFSFLRIANAADDPSPKIIQTDKATITLYQPQPESFKGNILKGRFAVSVKTPQMKDPVFGVIWTDAILNTDRDSRMASLESLTVTDVRFPNEPDSNHVKKLKSIIEEDSKTWDIQISLDRLATSLEEADDAKALQDKISNTPPKFYFATEPTMLILVDGEPKFLDVEKYKLKRVANCPAGMFYDPSNKMYYLNGNGIWYESASVKDGWVQNNKLKGEMKSFAKDLAKQGTIPDPDSVDMSATVKILASTEPAELLQTNGKPEISSIKGTNLLYVKNSENQIFLDVISQKYYVLSTGRWFNSSSLENGPWSYVPQENLPEDFKKIPVGSEMDLVLANVAGTEQAQDAVRDAVIPQTATVDRKTATTSVNYDGTPKFSKVSGTDELYYSENSEKTVLRDDDNKRYYCVDDGVWYESSNSDGPWTVCTERPKEVDEISAESPVYNVKYVYIYDYTPTVVYVGYTPGYTGCYVYGPTVVYGTGYYYNPWYGAYYYPRPYTYGFNMTYNPWTGWSYGFSMSHGWYGYSYGYGGCCYGGWWGPPVYRPPYHYHCNHYYGSKSVHYTNVYNINYYGSRPSNPGGNNGGSTGRPSTLLSNGGNIYNTDKRPGVSGGTGVANRPGASNYTGAQPANPDRPNKGGANASGDRPGASTGGSADKRPGANNVYSDKKGDVYQNKGDKWQQYDGEKFQNTDKSGPSGNQNQNQNQNRPAANQNQNQNQNMGRPGSNGVSSQQQMNQMKQNRNDGQTRTQNYNQYQKQAPSGGAARPGASGGGTPKGGPR